MVSSKNVQRIIEDLTLYIEQLLFLGLSKSNIITKTILGRPIKEPVLQRGDFGHANRLDASVAIIKYGKMMLLLSFWITVTFN